MYSVKNMMKVEKNKNKELNKEKKLKELEEWIVLM